MDLLLWYPLYLVPAGVGWVAVWVSGSRQIDLLATDKALLYLPWIVLYTFSVIYPNGKSLGNLIEILALAAAVPVAMMVRIFMGRVQNQEQVAARVLGVVCVAAAALWLFVPPISDL